MYYEKCVVLFGDYKLKFFKVNNCSVILVGSGLKENNSHELTLTRTEITRVAGV